MGRCTFLHKNRGWGFIVFLGKNPKYGFQKTFPLQNFLGLTLDPYKPWGAPQGPLRLKRNLKKKILMLKVPWTKSRFGPWGVSSIQKIFSRDLEAEKVEKTTLTTKSRFSRSLEEKLGPWGDWQISWRKNELKTLEVKYYYLPHLLSDYHKSGIALNL